MRIWQPYLQTNFVALCVALGALGALGTGAGCQQLSSQYCAENPSDPDCASAFGDAQNAMCDHSRPDKNTCPASAPVCSAQNVCVQCEGDGAGPGMGQSPQCDGDVAPVCANSRCGECTKHEQCDSLLCLPSGACAPVGQVAYVSADGSLANDCSAPEKACTTVGRAVANLGTKKFIKVDTVIGAIRENSVLSNVSFTLVGGEGGRITRDGNGSSPIFTISGGTISMIGIELFDSGAAPALRVSGGDFTLAKSRLTGNGGGAVHVSDTARVSLLGNIIYANGNSQLSTPAVKLDSNQIANSRVEFNSFYNNRSIGKTAIVCNGPVPVANNAFLADTLNADCSYSYNLTPVSEVLPQGTANMAGDPGWANPGGADFTPTANSPVIGLGSPRAALTEPLLRRDLTGRPRVMRDGRGPDVGAIAAP